MGRHESTRSHTVVAIARDSAGNQTISLPVSVNVVSAAVPYSISTQGGKSYTVANDTPPVRNEYARLQTSGGTALPSGVAIVGFRTGNVWVSETGVPASQPMTDGRIYAETSALVKTGIVLNNPSSQEPWSRSILPTTLEVTLEQDRSYWVPKIKFRRPSTNHHLTGRSLQGTLTFTSASPISVVGERGFTNERARVC